MVWIPDGSPLFPHSYKVPYLLFLQPQWVSACPLGQKDEGLFFFFLEKGRSRALYLFHSSSWSPPQSCRTEAGFLWSATPAPKLSNEYTKEDPDVNCK